MASRTGGVRLAAGWVLVALAFSGCAGIPTTGPVVQGEPVRREQAPPYVSVVPAPPPAGASESAVVSGWLSAMGSYVPGYPVARQFMTPEAAATWQPSAGVTVVDDAGGPALATPSRGRVTATLEVVALLAGDGSYRAVDPPRGRRLDLRLERVDGEWRIANPPAGVLLSRFDFERDFGPVDIFFFDPLREVLVPDPVYLPVRASRTTLLVAALLRGPSAWLDPAVATAFPEGTALDIRSVPVDSGTAEVALSAAAQAAAPQQREQMLAQLAFTLRQVPDVERVSVTAGGVPLLAARPTAEVRGAYVRYEPQVLDRDAALLAVQDGAVVRLEDGGPRPVPGPLGRGEVALQAVAVDVSADQVVGVVAGGRRLVMTGFDDSGGVRTLLAGTNLSSPAFDRTGLVWVVDRRPGGSVLLVSDPQSGAWAPVRVPELSGSRVDSLAISLDGTRAAVVTGGRVLVATLVRDRDEPTAVRLRGLHELPVDGGRAVDAGWAEPSELAILVHTPDGDPQVSVAGLGGARTVPRGAVPGAVALAAAPGQRLAVSTTDGRLLQLDSVLRWMEVGRGRAPAYPG